MPRKWLYIREIAAELEESEDKVLRWIQSGELVAYNFATKRTSARGRWKTTREHLDAFILSRKTSAPVPRRRRGALPPVESFV